MWSQQPPGTRRDHVEGRPCGALQKSLNAPPWDGPDVWLHGDLLAGNLLVVNGRISAVVRLNVGDPASDLQPVWKLGTRFDQPQSGSGT
jgi:aminoglycoside phosphotransferase (APT) family kinase protein